MINILSIDVEEYFHPSEVQRDSGVKEWARMPSRVEPETDRVLELLARHSARATFFIVGWVAEQRPRLVRRIAEAGHEIGCHSYAHRLIYRMTPAEFREDTRRAVAAIEDAAGAVPRLYRAPSYSITRDSWWALDVLAECGFQYDSSIYPIHHDRYGIPGFERTAQVIQTGSGPIVEVPIATTELGNGKVVPVGGGAYLRLLPYRFTAAGIRRINEREQRPACMYFHPWEIDPEQPRIASGVVSRLRTYTGLRGMERKLERLLEDFRFSTMTAVYPEVELRPAAPERPTRASRAVAFQASGIK